MATRQKIIDTLLDIKENGGCIYCTDKDCSTELIEGIISLRPGNVGGWEVKLKARLPVREYIHFSGRSFYESSVKPDFVRYEYPLCTVEVSPQTENEFLEMLQ